MKNIFIFTLALLFLASCNPTEAEPEPYDPHRAAIPDGSADIETELSEEDKRKLAQASGREAELVSIRTLNDHLGKLKTPSGLIYFWSLKDNKSVEKLKIIGELASQVDSRKMDILLVHLDKGADQTEINSIVRESGVGGNIYIMESKDDIAQMLGNKTKRRGKSGNYYIYSTAEKTGFWFEKPVDYGELYVTVQPFVL